MGFGLNPSLPPGLIELATSCALIITNPKMFPTLGCGKEQKRYLYTSPNRERRAERLETVARLMAVLALASDLLSLSDGRRVGGVCHPLTELQIAELLGLGKIEDLEHDTTGMRAIRSAAQDAESAGFITRKQPKVRYCNAGDGGCGRKVSPKTRTCRCGRRECWRYRSLPTIITITKEALEAFGVREAIEKEQGERYADQQAGLVGPRPDKDVRLERELSRINHAQQLAAKRVRIDPEQEDHERRRLERLYGRKLE